MGISGYVNDYFEEKGFKGATKPIPRNTTKKIDSQLEKSICKINIEEDIFGTGFLCKIPYPDEFKLLPVLITNNHVINKDYYFGNKTIKISFNDDKNIKLLDIVPERQFYTNEIYDITIIEIFPNKDNLNHFLELNEYIDEEKNESYKNQNIYILHYPNGEVGCVSYGNIIYIKDSEIKHKCWTENGSSGSPIILLETLKVIGVHKGTEKGFNYNCGTLLKYPIIEFNEKKEIKIENENENEIIIRIKIEEEEINKDIKILNNKYNTNSDEIKEDADEIKMNKSNTLMFINNKEVDFETIKKFDKKGIYEIKLKLKIELINAYCMFLGCENIININLSKFKTKNINNMREMFNGCIKLTNINLSNFDTQNVKNMCAMFYNCNNLININLSSFDTKNVTTMNAMFYGCNNLTNINLSSFDTKYVIDMAGMFYNCNKISNINLSSFDTKNVTTMNSMFYACEYLTNINLSNFNTKNVTDMGCMFDGCKNLTNINISSFDTRNVTNMNGLFYNCNNLTNINLSSFDTKNVTDMTSMFYGCNNLIDIDLSSFHANNSIKFYGIFKDCLQIKKIIISSSFYQIIKSEIYQNIELIFK